MSDDDVYIYEAIGVEPAITEAETAARVAAGSYRKVTWDDDGRLGDGYFVQAGEHRMIGIAMIPEVDAEGTLFHLGVAVQVNPLVEDHQDATVEMELRAIVDDFAVSPDGTRRRFEGALHIVDAGRETRVGVRHGVVIRERTENATGI